MDFWKVLKLVYMALKSTKNMNGLSKAEIIDQFWAFALENIWNLIGSQQNT